MRVVSFKISTELLEELDNLAKTLGKTRSEVIREALEMYVKIKTGEIMVSRKVKRVIIPSDFYPTPKSFKFTCGRW